MHYSALINMLPITTYNMVLRVTITIKKISEAAINRYMLSWLATTLL